MTYRGARRPGEEIVRNSRDGVTPLVVRLRDGWEASRADWAADLRVPALLVATPGAAVSISVTPW